MIDTNRINFMVLRIGDCWYERNFEFFRYHGGKLLNHFSGNCENYEYVETRRHSYRKD